MTGLRLHRVLVLAVAALGLGACSFRIHDRPPGGGRYGALGTVLLAQAGTLDPVELLATADSGLYLLYERRIGLARYPSIRRATFPRGARKPALSDGRAPDDSARARLDRLARFPGGLPGVALDSLLKAYGQSNLGVFAR